MSKKQYYIKMPEKMMTSKLFSSTEKIFIGFLEVLTDKGNRSTDKSNIFLAVKIGKSATYIASIIKKLVKVKIISIGREYGRRTISFNESIKKSGYINIKAVRGVKKN